MRRPGPLWWLWYAVGGTLPDRFRHWVLWDLTSPWWVARHLSHSVVLLAPWWLLMLVPGPLSLRFSMVALAYITGLYFSLSFMEHIAERRLIKHGFPAGLNRKIREEAETRDRAEVVALYVAFHDRSGT